MNNAKVLLFNPPGKILIRGEGRSDTDTDPETSLVAANWVYPPMNLAYGAACLRDNSSIPTIKDYPAERKTIFEFESDLVRLQPDICVINLNPSSEADDLAAVKIIHKNLSRCKIIAYAPYLALYEISEIPVEIVKNCDVVLIAEHPETLIPIANALLTNKTDNLGSIEGILYWSEEKGFVIKTRYPLPVDLDSLPLPARDLLNNRLYLRPDNNSPQAIIQTSRGCVYKCTFCLVPPLTGKEFTQRSIESVISEVKDCVNNHGINQIFFRADTFTINKMWVKGLCKAIIDSGLKISWCANSRANCIDEEMLGLMHKSGCWLLAFGFESGCPETLERIKKGTTVEDNERARRLCRRYKIKVQGQYIIGFPWEGKSHLNQTLGHLRRMRSDFADIQILVPYRGTEVYEELIEINPSLIQDSIGSKMEGGVLGTSEGLTKEDLIRYQKRMMRAAYLSPVSILMKISDIRSYTQFKKYLKYGVRMIKKSL